MPSEQVKALEYLLKRWRQGVNRYKVHIMETEINSTQTKHMSTMKQPHWDTNPSKFETIVQKFVNKLVLVFSISVIIC